MLFFSLLSSLSHFDFDIKKFPLKSLAIWALYNTPCVYNAYAMQIIMWICCLSVKFFLVFVCVLCWYSVATYSQLSIHSQNVNCAVLETTITLNMRKELFIKLLPIDRETKKKNIKFIEVLWKRS